MGKSPAIPDAGGAQSGYLLSEHGYGLLLDCGGGVFAKLRALRDPAQVDAVLISHLHADHVLDLLPFGFALAQGLAGLRGRRPPLWVPPGGAAVLDRFTQTLGMGRQITAAFAVTEYDPALPLRLGPLTVSFCEVPHYVRTWACDLRSAEGTRLTFGADCGPSDAIAEFARATDLLMLEATEGPGPHRGAGFRGHLTAAEAGELARLACARRLLLTHYSDTAARQQLQAAAEAGFGGPVELAAEGCSYVVSGRRERSAISSA